MIATRRLPNGQTEQISEAQVTAMVLDEFYQKTQVMIGEAVAASEVASFLSEHSADLPGIVNSLQVAPGKIPKK